LASGTIKAVCARDDTLYEIWVTWLDRIIQEAYRIHHYRQLWRALAEMTQAAELPPSAIFPAFGAWYAASQASAVRRQLDPDRRNVSLRRVLEDIAMHPTVMTRERHIDLWMHSNSDPLVAEANANFDRFASAADSEHIDVALVQADLASLRATARAVQQFVNTAIAHSSEQPTNRILTYGELDTAIDGIQ
jgi:hypothetical protein